MSNKNEKRFTYSDRTGTKAISESEIEKILARIGMEYTLEFIIRDLEAGIPYVGADFRITNPAEE